MNTVWRWRSCIIVPVALAAQANAVAAMIDPDRGGLDTFSDLQASAAGELPASHLLAVVPATDAIVSQMDAAGGALPGMLYFRWAWSAQTLQATNTDAALGVAWGLAESLAYAGLTLINTGGH